MLTKTIVFSLAAVWLSAVGAAGALAYTVNRPLDAHATLRESPLGLSSAAVARVVLAPAPASPTVSVVEFAPLVVHARAPYVSPVYPKELRCGAWQPMEQGSTEQWVRSCD